MTLDHLRSLRDPTRSERFLQRVPVALLDYPLETLLSAWGVLSGIPLLLRLASPPSINDLLPEWLVTCWAVAFAIGAATIAAGLVTRRFGTLVARGLRLLATACIVYASAILVVIGPLKGVPSWPLLGIIGALCYFRAWWLRTRDRILRGIDASARDTEEYDT